MQADRHTMLAATGLMLVVVAVLIGLHPSLISADLSTRIGGGFHPGHAWAMDRVADMLWSDASWRGDGVPMAYPDTGHVRLIGWGGLLLGAVWVPLIGLLPAYHLAWILNIILSAWLAAALIRRATGASAYAAAGASLIYALGPMALGFIANGQMAKLHMWCMPLCLLLADRAIREPRSWWAILGVGLSSSLTGFSSPSIALVLPFALGCWVVFRATGPRRWVWAAAVLAIAAAGLVLPLLYHQLPGQGTAVLRPAAPIPGLVHPLWLSPAAQPADLFAGLAPWSAAPDGINNVAYLGLPALVGGLALARGSAVRGLGLGLTLLGIVLALGPAIDGDGVRWVMPAVVLEWVRYPVTQSGMYYRFGQIAALGLALLVASPKESRRPWALPWVLGLLNIGAGIWATQAIWPRPMAPFPGAAIYAQMAADPAPGAVLDLPLETIDTDGSKAALAQAMHGRHSTALVHNISVEASPRLRRFRDILQLGDLAGALREAGIRYVVLRPARGARPDRALARRLTAALGSPLTDQAGPSQVQVWTVQ